MDRNTADIDDRQRAARRETQRSLVLEQLAKGRPLQAILDSIVAMVEQELPESRCSILLLDATGQRLLLGSAPQLPAFYNEAIHGLEIGPTIGSCGAAAYSGRRTIAEDIETHPFWVPYLEYARKAKLGSCWSEPIKSSTGQVLGTFAIYHAHPASPTPLDLDNIASAAHVASIAIERTRAEETLRASEKKYRDLVETSHDLIWSVDAEGRWTFVNGRGARAIYGYEPEEMLGRPFTDFEPPERQRADLEEFAAIKAGKSTYSYETVHLHKDGRRILLSFNAIPLIDAEGRVVGSTGTARDITEAKRADDDRRRLEAQFQHAQKLESLGLLAGGIAHDFNNLLTSILGYADMAERELPADSAARALIAESVRGARRAAELTKQMLAYSGKGRFVLEPLDLSSLARDMSRLLEISISKKCTIEYDLASGLPAVEGDATQIQQVMMNLVINASEAIGDRAGEITIRTRAVDFGGATFAPDWFGATLEPGRYVLLDVEDTGCGMAPETRARIFDPFFTTKFTGRGLGLAAVLGIVRGHHGAIRVESTLGSGTSMKVYFPAVPAKVAPPPRSTASQGGWKGAGTVLGVDDEDSVRRLARRMLETMGFAVQVAADGAEALAALKAAPTGFAVVLLDLTMPQMSGEETLRVLRALRPDLRVILSSGYNDPATTRELAGPTPTGFVQKPYTFEELRTAMRAAVEAPPAAPAPRAKNEPTR